MPPVQSEGVQRALKHAYHTAGRYRRRHVHTEHLLLGLLQERNSATHLLASLGYSRDTLRRACERRTETGSNDLEDCMRLTPRVQQIMALAIEEMRAFGHCEIDTRHVLLGAVLEEEGIAGEVLRGEGVAPEAIRAALASPDAERAPRSGSRTRSRTQASAKPGFWQRLIGAR